MIIQFMRQIKQSSRDGIDANCKKRIIISGGQDYEDSLTYLPYPHNDRRLAGYCLRSSI